MVDSVGRVFAAVPLPAVIRLALADEIGGMEIPGKVVPAENWHITLRFLGTVDVVTYERFLEALSSVGSVAPFPIRLDGYGAFPGAKKANVFWAGVGEGAPELSRLNEVSEDAAQGAGLAPEERPYHAHLTLSRIRPPQDLRHIVDRELDLRWECDSVVVYRSHTGRSGARYEPLETFEFSG